MEGERTSLGQTWLLPLLSALLFPALQIVGSITWSAYALSLGLGLVSLIDAQYTIAGIITAFCTLIWYGILVIVHGISVYLAAPLPPKVFRPLGQGLFQIFAGALTPALVFKLLARHSFSEISDWAILLLCLFTLSYFAWMNPPFRMDSKIRRRKDPTPLDRALISEDQMRQWRRRPNRANMVALALVGMLLVGVSVGFSILPNIDSDFGGAKPRQAVFVIDGSQLDNDTVHVLRGNGTIDDTVFRTVRLTVLFSDEHRFFVRIPPEDGPDDKSYDFQSGVVKAVFWYD